MMKQDLNSEKLTAAKKASLQKKEESNYDMKLVWLEFLESLG